MDDLQKFVEAQLNAEQNTQAQKFVFIPKDTPMFFKVYKTINNKFGKSIIIECWKPNDEDNKEYYFTPKSFINRLEEIEGANVIYVKNEKRQSQMGHDFYPYRLYKY